MCPVRSVTYVSGRSQPGQKLGFGLVGMRERILALGGTLNVVTGDGGVTVEALVPTGSS